MDVTGSQVILISLLLLYYYVTLSTERDIGTTGKVKLQNICPGISLNLCLVRLFGPEYRCTSI